MQQTYELRVSAFEGPLHKLLELIEARELAISEISIAEVTDDFLRFLEALRSDTTASAAKNTPKQLRILADFIVIASRLIFIKSKTLLPDLALDDEAADIKDLEERLKLYRDLKPAMKHVAALWRTGHRMHVRPYLLNTASMAKQADRYRVFYPPSALSPHILARSLDRIFESAQRTQKEQVTVRDDIISLEAKISEIISHITSAIETSFSQLASQRSREEVIVTFLALLHLAREQLVFLEQKGDFSDILVTRSASNGEEGGVLEPPDAQPMPNRDTAL